MKSTSKPFIEIINKEHFLSNHFFSRPYNGLNEYVSHYWETNLEFKRPSLLEEKFLPLASYSMIVNLGSPYRLFFDDKLYTIEGDVIVTRSRPVKYIYVRGNKIFGIHFSADLLSLFYKQGDPSNFPHVSNLKECDEQLEVLARSIKMADDFETRTSISNKYLMDWEKKLAETKKTQLRYVVANTRDIEASVIDSMNIKEAAMNNSLTVRSFERYYLNTIGITPKYYWRIIRFRKAIAHFFADQKKFFPKEFGYHSYAHFYKEAIEMTGEAPVDLKK